MVMCIGTSNFLIAQPYTIEEIGEGVMGQETPELIITDLSSVDKVIVEAIAEIINPRGSVYTYPQDVEFKSDGTTKTSTFISIAKDNELGVVEYVGKDGDNIDYYYYSGNNSDYYLGYYTETFMKSEIAGNGKIILDKKGQGDHILTFYAYVYRDNGTVELYSKLADNKDRYYIFHNGEGNAAEYEFSLPTGNVKDIEVVVPLSDNTDIDTRIGVLSLYEENIKKKEKTFKLNKDDTNFQFIIESLTDVGDAISSIQLKIYSPVSGDGDSFFSGVPIINVEEKPGDEPEGCTYTQGYWKTHSTYGPAKKADPTWDDVGGPDAPFFSSGKTYLQVLNTPPKGNAYYILAHQYIAAELNLAAGASDSDIATEFAQVTNWFNSNGPMDVSKSNKNMLIGWANLLDQYNNGLIGPGHCDDMEKEEIEEEVSAQTSSNNKGKGKAKGKKKSAEISVNNSMLEINDLKVYPNPVTNSATISFSPIYDGNVTVDLYNSLGQRTSRLMDRMVDQDFQVTLSINSSDFREGLYILRVQNESSIGTTRIQIGR